MVSLGLDGCRETQDRTVARFPYVRLAPLSPGLLHLLFLQSYNSFQSVLKEINPEYSMKGLMLKLQYFGHLMWRADSLEKTLMLGKIEEKGATKIEEKDEMVGWHHCLNGHESEETQRDSDGQRSLACYSPWGCKESDTT